VQASREEKSGAVFFSYTKKESFPFLSGSPSFRTTAYTLSAATTMSPLELTNKKCLEKAS
jgi:hypothetical protein